MATRIVEQTVCTCEKVTDVTEVPDESQEGSSGGSLLGALVVGALALCVISALGAAGESTAVTTT